MRVQNHGRPKPGPAVGPLAVPAHPMRARRCKKDGAAACGSKIARKDRPGEGDDTILVDQCSAACD
jgi:hypothetical protein